MTKKSQSKKGKTPTLNEVQRVYIEAKHLTMSAPEIAEILGVTSDVVIAHIAAIPPPPQPEEETPKMPTVYDLMGGKSNEKGRSVAVMTQAASELADTQAGYSPFDKNKNGANKATLRTRQHITKCKGK